MPTPTVPNTRLLPDLAADPSVVAPLREVLGQLRRLLDPLDADHYTRKPVTTYGGSVGGHVRHCLDHVSALLGGVHGGPDALVDYEARQRGTDIENDRDAALAEVRRLDAELARMPESALAQTVTTSVFLAADRPALRAPSTVSREIAFVLSHTIHHNAMIGGMVKALGGRVPDGFGMAPGTLRHQQQQTATA
ncbi:MAG: DinB family protein [Planctomycetota bacterium]